MEKLNRRELDSTTGEQIVIELTAEEVKEREELAKAEAAARLANDSAKATAKAELLNRLGITDEEVRLLLS
jgi:hypothetical protein